MRVADFSFPQIEEQLRRRPSLIVPVGGLEPIGESLPLGTVNRCCESIADGLSIRLKVLAAPLLAYGNSIPFKSFGGCAGVHRDTLSTIIMECCNCWLFHGFKRIMVLTLAMDGRQGIDTAVKRLNKTPGRDNAVRYCSLQADERFRSLCASRFAGIEYGRSEWGVRTLAGYLYPELPGSPVVNNTPPLPDAADFKKWHRRGRDPEKLRKMAPHASFSAFTAAGEDGTGACRDLFERVLDFLTEEFSPFLTFTDNASR
jgi:hypothetical protein